jgi:hypothetical protein
MAAARCSPCDLWMPSDRDICPVCEGPTWESKYDEWPVDWKQEAAILKKRVKPNTPIPNITEGQLHKVGKFHFIDKEAPKRFGYLDIEAGSILKFKGRFFEVVGPLKELGWMLEVIKLVMNDSEIKTLTETQYQALDAKRGIRT